jgi:hypothetical protein
MEPRVEVLTVTEVEEAAVTTPVTSSTKSNCPVPRLEVGEVGASMEAVRTFTALRSTFETTWGGAVLIVMALAKLNWIRTAVCWLAAKVAEKVEVAGVEAVVWET